MSQLVTGFETTGHAGDGRPPVVITGLGSAVPPQHADQPTLAAAAAPNNTATPRQRRLLDTLYQRTTVARRSSVLLKNGQPIEAFYRHPEPGEEPAPVNDPASPTTAERMAVYRQEAGALAIRVARAAIVDAGLDAAGVTHLVTVSCTGFHNPGVDFELMDALGLTSTVQRLNVGFMGCHGALAGMRAAGPLAAGGGTVLLVCVELCSLHFQYGTLPDHLVANALFADGAAAMLLQPHHADAEERSDEASGIRVPLHYRHALTAVIPDTRDAMSWSVTDHGFAMTLSPKVPQLVADHLPPLVDQLLAPHDFGIDDVAGWAIHPGGPRVVAAALEALGLPESAGEASRRVLRNHGNLSSPTVLLILERLLRQDAHRDGPIVMLAVGPGLSLEAALLTV